MQSPSISAQLRHDFEKTAGQIGDFASDLPAGILLEDTSGCVLGCNDALCSFLGIESPAASLVGQSSREVVRRARHVSSNAPDFIRRMSEIVADGKFISGEQIQVEDKTLERDFIPVYLGSELAGYCWLHRDVTERVRALAELRASEKRFETIFRSAPLAMALSNVTDGTFVDVNPVFTTLMGYGRDEVLGRTSNELGFFPDPAIRTEFVEQVVREGSFRSEAVGVPTRDGSERMLELSVSVIDIDHERCLLTIAEDVTEQYRAEQALKESEERFRLLAENSRDIIFRYRVNEPARMEYISPSVTRIAGYAPEEYYADPGFPTSVVHPDDRAEFDRMIVERLEGPVELRWLRRDGSLLWTEQTNVYVTDEDGSPLAIEGVIRDITARKDAEFALRESEARFRLLAENAHDIIFRYRVTEPRGTEYMSPSVTRVAGYSPEDYYADPDFILSVIHPDDEHLLAHMATIKEPQSFKLRWIRKDGAVVWADQTMVPVFDDSGMLVAVEGVGRDITARVEAEEALQHARDELEGRVEQEMAKGNAYNLTFREFTVLHHVAAGETDKVIAAALGISPLTVHKHVASILAKMRATSRTEAGVRAIRERLLDLPQQSAE